MDESSVISHEEMRDGLQKLGFNRRVDELDILFMDVLGRVCILIFSTERMTIHLEKVHLSYIEILCGDELTDSLEDLVVFVAYSGSLH